MADQDAHLKGTALPSTGSPFFFVRHRFSTLYSDYRASWFLWSIVSLARKGLMVSATAAYFSQPELARRILVSVLVVSTFLESAVKPYGLPEKEIPGRSWSSVMYVCVVGEFILLL